MPWIVERGDRTADEANDSSVQTWEWMLAVGKARWDIQDGLILQKLAMRRLWMSQA